MTDGKPRHTEDDLAQRIIKNFPDSDFWVEVDYNDYGTRGSVDLVDRRNKINKAIWLVHEFKSAFAVEQATGANEIIRQFNKHKNHFFSGAEIPQPKRSDAVKWYLSFIPCETTIKHYKNNAALYEVIADKDTFVVFRDPRDGLMINPRTEEVPSPTHYQE